MIRKGSMRGKLSVSLPELNVSLPGCRSLERHLLVSWFALQVVQSNLAFYNEL
ncbi:hypothetical protein [Leptospira noguchii]|uniref:hypothetical protein n=1 Tax=Leptospira noguchii TaxID=28182 RepID=UPI001FB73C4B|nr:hypothetical protein [Leptospira noguchii]UOG53694.1 hypothetical protein MAL09_06020 [Leptospira noguchii]